MKLHQLKALIAAVDTGSVRAGARKLFLSQPALTKALRELEEEVGVSLIHRSVRGITPTAGGTRLLARARLIDQQLLLAQAELRQMQGLDEGSVSIGVTPLVAMTVFHQAVAAFRRRYHNVALNVVSGLHGIAESSLRHGSMDFGVSYISEVPIGEDLTVEHWFSAPNVMVVREGHPKANAHDLTELAGLEWLVASLGSFDPETPLSRFFKEAGLSVPRLKLRCEFIPAAGNILRHSDIVAMLPAALMDCIEYQGLRAVPLKVSLPWNNYGMIKRVDVPLTPVAEDFAAILKQKLIQRFGRPPKKEL
jgi:DNA-binding transcriptional LysR family regulator